MLMTRILITDHYPLNKGISAILSATIACIRADIPNAEIVVLSYWPDQTHCDVKVYGWLIKKENPLRLIRGVLGCLLFCLVWKVNRNAASSVLLGLDKEKRETLQEYGKADLILQLGGILDISGGHLFGGVFASLPSLFSTFVCELLGKPVMIYAYSVLPFKNISLRDKLAKFSVRLIWNRVQLITLRDENSKKNLRGLGVNRPEIRVTADPAILLKPASEKRIREILDQEGLPKNQPLVAITVVDFYSKYSLKYHYRGSSSPLESHEHYQGTIAAAIDYMIEKYGITAVFVPMEVSLKGYPLDDRYVIDRIVKRIKNKTKTLIINGEYTSEELEGLFAHMDLLVGTRMHSIILATAMLTPTIAIAYEPKVDEFMSRIGQQKWICGFSNISLERLVQTIDEMWATREYVRKSLETNLGVVQTRASLNSELARDLLGNH
jgi:polysaccharide pyruvyl transferase WcaK-like protein